MIIENAQRFTRFSLLGVKTRMEGGEEICTFPVGKVNAKFFALECSGGDIQDEYHELDTDIAPEVWAGIILDENPHIRNTGLEMLF